MDSRKIYNGIKIILFLAIFGFISLLTTSQYGTATGLYSTLLVWSFYVLCIPISGSALLTSRIIHLFTKKSIPYPGIISWTLAVFVNLFTYFVIPYMYLTLTTTHLLYQIISNPWPYWIIIGASAMGSLYNAFIIRTNKTKYSFKHKIAKTILFTMGIGMLLYFSYMEIVILLSSRIH